MSTCVQRVLLTGGGGFIGRHLHEGLSRQGHEVLAPRRAELDLLDERATRAYLERQRPDVVVHAAKDTTAEAAGQAYTALRDNLRMYYVLERCAGLFGKLVNLGSGAEYDRARMPPRVREEAFGEHVPRDDYGLSKYVVGRQLETRERGYDLRLFGVYGPYEEWRRRFVSLACCKAMWGLPITIRRNARFDYMWAGDLAAVVDRFVSGDPEPRALNVCTGAVVDLMSIARRVVEVAARPIEIQLLSEEPGGEYSGDDTRLRKLGGLTFSSVSERVPELYAFYASRKDQYPLDALRGLV